MAQALPVTTTLVDVSLGAVPRQKTQRAGDFGAALASCALTWHQQPDEDTVLQAITGDVARLLPGADAAAVVTASAPGKLQISASHGPVEMWQGALSNALEPASVNHRAGSGSMICVPLVSEGIEFGTLLVLGFATDAFTAHSATDVTTLAIHASVALAAARGRSHLEAAMTSRDVIGQAKGILMCQRQVTALQAFDLLLRASQHSNTKLRLVAENLCLTGELIDPCPTIG